jgi:hypothetical protein
MLIKLFKSRQQFVIILILILTILFWIPSIAFHKSVLFVFDFYPAPLYKPLQFIEYSYPVAATIFSLALVIIIGFMLVRLNVRFFFIQTRTQLPAFFYILICSSFIPLHRMNPVLIGCFILVLAIYKIFDTYKKEKLCYNFFDAAMLISVASMFYFNFIFFILVIWAGLILLRPFILREWIFSVVGFILPYILIFSYYYLRDYDISRLFDVYRSYFSYGKYDMKFDLSYKLLLIYYLLLLLIGSIYMMSVYTTRKIYSRKYFMFFLWLFLITVAVYCIIPSAGYEMILILSISVSFLFTHYYINIKSGWINDLLFNLFPGLLIYLRIVNI